MASIAQTQMAGSNKVIEELIGDSSWIAKIKYDPAQLQLTVTTKRGDEYVHFMVYPMTVDQLLQSPSKGKFYAQAIKGKGLSTKVVTKSTGAALRNAARGPVKSKARRPGYGR
jgi:KTSC domain